MVSEFIVVVADLLHSVQPEGMQAPRNRWLLPVYYSRVYPLLRALLSRSLPSLRFFPRIMDIVSSALSILYVLAVMALG